MAWVWVAAVGLVAVLVGVLLWWRYAARRRALPCPAWLAWLLTDSWAAGGGAGSARILDRLDLAPGMQVLDVGCGPGRVSIPAARRVAPGGQVLALDMQAAMLKKLEQRAATQGVANIQTVEGAIEQAALEPDRFDRALLVAVLGEVPDREAALRGIYAALKPGGILSVTEVLVDPHYQRRATLLRLAEAAGFGPGRYFGGGLGYTLHLVKPPTGT